VTASLGYLPFAPRRARRLDWVDTSSSPDGEAAVHRRPTRERQVTNTLLSDCAIKPPAAEADVLPVDRRFVLLLAQSHRKPAAPWKPLRWRPTMSAPCPAKANIGEFETKYPGKQRRRGAHGR